MFLYDIILIVFVLCCDVMLDVCVFVVYFE